MNALSGKAAAVLALAAGTAWPAEQPCGDPQYRHGISYVMPLRYGPDFAHFAYANPEAPKGGTMRVAQMGTVSEFTQETPTLYIDVDDHRDELIAALARRDIVASVDGLSVVVEQDSEQQYDGIRDAVVEVNARLRRLAPRRRQLTDIFRSPPE